MPNKVVLAYSGGLDTSVAIKWIKEKHNMDVIGGTSPKQVERALAAAKKIVGVESSLKVARAAVLNLNKALRRQKMR